MKRRDPFVVAEESGTLELETVRQLAAIAEAHGLTELHYSVPGGSVILRRAPASATASAAPPIEPAAGQAVVRSPFVGTFFRSPQPESPPFAHIGQRVRKGDVLCIVEAMKLMNEIEADVEGIVSACLAENGQSVTQGQPLFLLSQT
jgi:acetyl-CoA carboxylase biotin carboxyl carrier protein